MKAFKLFTILLIFSFLSFTLNSCLVLVDNGKPKGWSKNTNNPHHPFSTNPGKGHGKKHK